MNARAIVISVLSILLQQSVAFAIPTRVERVYTDNLSSNDGKFTVNWVSATTPSDEGISQYRVRLFSDSACAVALTGAAFTAYVDGNQKVHQFQGLSPKTKYFVRVSAYDTRATVKGPDSPCSSGYQLPYPTKVFGVMTDMAVSADGNLHVAWQQAISSDAAGVSQYRVRLFEDTKCAVPVGSAKYPSGRATSVQFSNLDPKKMYRARVRAYDKNNTSMGVESDCEFQDVDPLIASFRVTPSVRKFNQPARLSWTAAAAEYCQLSTLANQNLNPSSKLVSLDRLTIPPLSTQPSSHVTTNYTLRCFKHGSPTASKTIALTTEPIESIADNLGNGAVKLVPGPVDVNDPYGAYGLRETLDGSNQVLARVAQKIPLSSSLSGASSSMTEKSSEPAAIVSNSEANQIFAYATGAPGASDTIEVPYFSKVKVEWKFASNAALGNSTVTRDSISMSGCSWLDYLTNVWCPQSNLPFPNCLIGNVPGGPSVTSRKPGILGENYLLPRDGKIWPPICNSHKDGSKVWIPTPEEPEQTWEISSAFHRSDEWFTGARNRNLVTVKGKKCEKKFSTVFGSIMASLPTKITEESFRQWAIDDEFDHMEVSACAYYEDPYKCNSGDLANLKDSLYFGQNTCEWGQPESEVWGEPELQAFVKDLANGPRVLGMRFLTGMGHAVIALSGSRTNLLFKEIYRFKILDPNGPSVTKLYCEKARVEVEGHLPVVVCKYVDDSMPPFIAMVYEPRNLGGAADLSKMRRNKVPGRDVAKWLENNYPYINNNNFESGVCSAWSHFVLRTGYVGEFVGECPSP